MEAPVTVSSLFNHVDIAKRKQGTRRHSDAATLLLLGQDADQVWTVQPQNPQHSVDYNYTLDRLNRSSVVDNGATISFDANWMNQYVGIGGQTVQYDQNFNLSLLNGWTYGYDAEKHLMVTSNGGGSSASFVYDGLGRCVKRTINGVSTRFVYDGWKAVMEVNPQTNHLVAWNIYGPGADEILWRWVEGVGHMRYEHALTMPSGDGSVGMRG
jgi:YD repeat-containing protein